jgi:hypothetical protein
VQGIKSKKQQKMKKYVKFLFAWLLIVASVQSCQKDGVSVENEKVLTTLKKPIPELEMDDARRNYESVKSSSSATGSTCVILPILPITPEWSKSTKHSFEKYAVVETPLLWDNKQLGMINRKKGDAIQTKPSDKAIEIVTNLITVRDESDAINSKIMIISGSSDYLKSNSIKKNSYKSKDPHFSGTVVYYNLDGSFYVGWGYTDGNVTSRLAGMYCEQPTESRKMVEECHFYEECTDWYQYDYYGNKYYTDTTCRKWKECITYDDGLPDDDVIPPPPSGGYGGTGSSSGAFIDYSVSKNCIQDRIFPAGTFDFRVGSNKIKLGSVVRTVHVLGIDCVNQTIRQVVPVEVASNVYEGWAFFNQTSPVIYTPIQNIDSNNKVSGCSVGGMWSGTYTVTIESNIEVSVGASVGFSVNEVYTIPYNTPLALQTVNCN